MAAAPAVWPELSTQDGGRGQGGYKKDWELARGMAWRQSSQDCSGLGQGPGGKRSEE